MRFNWVMVKIARRHAHFDRTVYAMFNNHSGLAARLRYVEVVANFALPSMRQPEGQTVTSCGGADSVNSKLYARVRRRTTLSNEYLNRVATVRAE